MSNALLWAGVAGLMLGMWFSLAENKHDAAQWCIAATCVAWTLNTAQIALSP